MGPGPATPGVDEIRRYHLDRLNDALRRSGTWGGETTIGVFLDDVAFVHGAGEEWRAAKAELRQRGAFAPTGVGGAVRAVLPGYRDGDAVVASVYAEVVRRLGWLTVDRTLSDDEYELVRGQGHRWEERDHGRDDLRAELGPPSVSIGGDNPRYSSTLVYAPADPGADVVCFHFAGTHDRYAPEVRVHAEPVLVAVRHGRGAFRDTFTFTPAGAAYRHGGPS